MNKVPISSQPTVQTLDVGTLSNLPKNTQQIAELDSQFQARHIAVNDSSLQMEVLMEGRWQTLRLTLDDPKPKPFQLAQGTVQVAPDGKTLTITTTPQTHIINDPKALIRLYNILFTDSEILPKQTTVNLTNTSISFPKLGLEFNVDKQTMALLRTEPKLYAVVEQSKAELSFKIVNGYSDPLMHLSMSLKHLARQIPDKFPELYVQAARTSLDVKATPLPGGKVLSLPLSTPEQFAPTGKWSKAIVKPFAETVSLIRPQQSFDAVLKHSLKQQIPQFDQTLQKEIQNQTTLLSLSDPKRFSQEELKAVIGTAIQKWIKTPFMQLKDSFSVKPGQVNAEKGISPTDQVTSSSTPKPSVWLQTPVMAASANRPTFSASAVGDLFNAIRQVTTLTVNNGSRADVAIPTQINTFVENNNVKLEKSLISTSEKVASINIPLAETAQKEKSSTSNKARLHEYPMAKTETKISDVRKQVNEADSSIKLKEQTQIRSSAQLWHPPLKFDTKSMPQATQVSGPIERLLSAKWAKQENLARDPGLQLSKTIDEVKTSAKQFPPELQRLVNQAFDRMWDERSLHPVAISQHVSSVTNSLPVQSPFLQALDKLLVTFLAVPKAIQTRPENVSPAERTEALVTALFPNQKINQLQQLVQSLMQTNQFEQLSGDLSKIQNQFNHVGTQQLNQQQSNENNWLINLFLPTKQTEEQRQTELQIGKYKKPAKAHLPEKTVWFVRLNFDLTPYGKLSAQAELMDKALDCDLVADTKAVVSLATPHLDALREKLASHGLQIGDISLSENPEQVNQFYTSHAIVNLKV
ncbi:flagellar hook-length control protein FliK [Pseudoalteromonas xiamenensis]|uniref:flagellar hook-length control protein FliK n=1 Tax=Pseudoalteromonas xiamenensis TaxID=882626 RepID=UPI0035E7BD60